MVRDVVGEDGGSNPADGVVVGGGQGLGGRGSGPPAGGCPAAATAHPSHLLGRNSKLLSRLVSDGLVGLPVLHRGREFRPGFFFF